MEQNNVITLKKPVMAHGEEITTITLREPNGNDIAKHGYPYTIDQNGHIILMPSPITDYICTLGMVTPSTINALSAPDMHALGWAVVGFFLGE